MEPLNPLHPNIRMHILHTVLCTFLKVLTRRICLSHEFCSRWSCPLFSWPLCLIQGWHFEEKLDASHSQGFKGQLQYTHYTRLLGIVSLRYHTHFQIQLITMFGIDWQDLGQQTSWKFCMPWNLKTYQWRRRACKKADNPSIIKRMATVSTGGKKIQITSETSTNTYSGL